VADPVFPRVTDPGVPRVTELRGTSDQLLLAIQTVALLEGQKRGLAFGDDRFPEMARAVRVAAQAVLDFSVAEESEAARIHDTSGADADATTTIATTRPAASLASILEEWRSVERRLTDAPAGSAEAIALLDAFERLRVRYADALADEVRRAKARDGGP
jgi:hypothetical protein